METWPLASGSFKLMGSSTNGATYGVIHRTVSSQYSFLDQIIGASTLHYYVFLRWLVLYTRLCCKNGLWAIIRLVVRPLLSKDSTRETELQPLQVAALRTAHYSFVRSLVLSLSAILSRC